MNFNHENYSAFYLLIVSQICVVNLIVDGYLLLLRYWYAEKFRLAKQLYFYYILLYHIDGDNLRRAEIRAVPILRFSMLSLITIVVNTTLIGVLMC